MAARMALPTASTPDADLARSRGYNADSIRQCQADQRLDVDGDLGPKTRSNIHKARRAHACEAAGREVKVVPVAEEMPRSCDAFQSRCTVVEVERG